jgi:hypothetical protein
VPASSAVRSVQGSRPDHGFKALQLVDPSMVSSSAAVALPEVLRPGSALKRREEFPHVLLSFRSIYAQSNSGRKRCGRLCAHRRCPEGRFPMKTVAEAIGVHAHVSWHTFAVPHPAQSSEHPNTVTYFCLPML